MYMNHERSTTSYCAAVPLVRRLASMLALVSLVLSGCESAQNEPGRKMSSSHLEVAKPITLTAKQISSVRAGVAKSLRNQDLEEVRVGRMLAGRTSTGVIVCGYLNAKDSSGEYVGERPFHGLFMGMDNASGFIVTGTGGADNETAETFEICRRSGLDLTPS
jgi:hypothetical protein